MASFSSEQMLGTCVEAPFGLVSLHVHDGAVTGLTLFADDQDGEDASTDPVLQRAAVQLQQYFHDAASHFDLPLAPLGTPFQQRVWAELRRVPPGQTCTYGELARRLGSGARAVANACRRNPLPIFIPCHRVVAAGGIGGYAGAIAGRELAVKHWLLQHEGVQPASVVM